MKKIISFIIIFFLSTAGHAEPSKTLNLYSWSYALTPEIVSQFEQETGIKVNLDVYDTPEVMETKLFAGHSGYDVVMVTLWPYFSSTECSYLSTSSSPLLPHWHGINKDLLNEWRTDPKSTWYTLCMGQWLLQ
jgi:putrescine transport system substrate-binding protein